ncbi:choline dehydrogenase [Fusarium longipes]|uniref:Choline dehydrogenase n=1 Tax=Fusarium longipes TaxID=694270 RepID=A0A395T655_9HYPO|nr:choline dehydrogenase [Fusarium longipes]
MSLSRAWLLSAAAAVFVSSADGYNIPRSAHQACRIANGTELLPSYDYVIVGGGTSGLTVADRLTEDGNTTVLVLEAGIFAPDADVLPVYGGGTQRQPRFFWQSKPQENLDNRTIDVWLGKMVGGSSGVNAMMASRGSAMDYDRWGKLFPEANGWDWEGMLPYFRKGLHLNPPAPQIATHFNMSTNTEYWGKTSPIQASFPNYEYPGLEHMSKAFYELPGVEAAEDSGAGGAGVYWFPTLMDPFRYERSFAENSHHRGLSRPNYHVAASSPVRRVILKKGVATGVEFYGNDGLLTVKANKEVLMAAGAVHTPKLLQLSGIGPKKLLQSAGIKTLVDLPGVGQNFQDHINIGVSIILEGLKKIHPNPFDMVNGTDFKEWADEAWAVNRTGPYSIAWGNLAGWLPLSAISPERHLELATELENQDHSSYLSGDVHPTVAKGYAAQMKNMANAMRSKDVVFARYLVDAKTGASAPILNQPMSRGSITIDPKDPYGANPIVDFGALRNPVERSVLVEMVKWYRRYNFETSLSGLAPNETAPGADIVSDEAISAWLSKALFPTDYHPAGTAAMMPLDHGGVVDQDLRVYGVKKLRVIDASIMPNLPGGNTCQPMYAVAEKAADIIKSSA